MATPSSRKTKSISAKTVELALAVPVVVAHRVTRMAIAGPAPSARDQKEFKLMVAEKNAAFAEAWLAMATQALRINQAMASSLLRSAWLPAGRSKPTAAKTVSQFQRAALGVLGVGLAPVHRKAVANAKRLAKTKLR